MNSYPTHNKRQHRPSSAQHGEEVDDEVTDSLFTIDGHGAPCPKRQRADLGHFPAVTGVPGPSIAGSGTFRLPTATSLVSQPGQAYTPAAAAYGQQYVDTSGFGLPFNFDPWNPVGAIYNGSQYLAPQLWPGNQLFGMPPATMGSEMDLATENSSHTFQHQNSFTDPPSQGSQGNMTVRDDNSDSEMFTMQDAAFPDAYPEPSWPGGDEFNTFCSNLFQNTESMTGIDFHIPLQPHLPGSAARQGSSFDSVNFLGLLPTSQFPYVPNSPNLSISPEPSPPDGANPTNTEFDNFFPSPDGPKPQTVSTKKTAHQRGRRQGHLNPEVKMKAKEMRKIKACLQCKLIHASCSRDKICLRCARLAANSAGSPLTGRVCNRRQLVDSEPLLCPDPLTAHLEETRVKAVQEQYVAFWKDVPIELRVTDGLTDDFMVFTANEFHPTDPKILTCSWLTTDENDGTKKYVQGNTLPLGLRDESHETLKAKCLEYIERIVDRGGDPNQSEEEKTSGLGWRVFGAIKRFFQRSSKAVNKTLLRNTLMLFAMHCFKSRTLSLTPCSVTSAFNLLQHPTQLPYKAIQTSRLIGCQLKSAMQSLIKDMSRTVLQELERELWQGGRAAWPTCFCVILILCMAAESVQVAMDGFVVFLLGRGVDMEKGKEVSRDTSLKVCRALDELHYQHCVDLFHGVYHTKNGASSGLFNPLKNGLKENSLEGVDGPIVALVEEIQGITRSCHQEIKDRAKAPTFDDHADDLKAHHLAFRAKNAGRLVANFLMSFAII